MRTQWPTFLKLGMWVLGGTSTTHVVSRHWMRIFNTSFAYLFWLANNKKVKYPEFYMGYIDETWYVGSDGHKYYTCGLVVTNCAYLIPHLHICSDWLITKKSNIQNSIWATLMKLGTWVVIGTSTTHVICCHQMHIFNTSFSYLFWLANNKKVKYPEFYMGYIDETWYVGSDRQKYYPCDLLSPNAHI